MKARLSFLASVLILFIAFFSNPAAAGITFQSLVPVRTINVDGDPSDWSGIDPWLTDPQGDSSCEQGTDWKAVYLARDEEYIYWRIDTWGDTFSTGDPNPVKFPMIHFYVADPAPPGTNSGGVKWQMFPGSDQYGVVMERVGSSTTAPWVHVYRGVEYGVVGSVGEGKVPLSMLDKFQINNVMVFYYAGYPNVACDIASWTYTPPPPPKPCPSEMPAPMVKMASVRTRTLPDGAIATLLAARLSGPSPDNVTALTVKSPSGVSTFVLPVRQTSLQHGLMYATQIPFPAEDGNYTFEVTDCQGRKDTVGKPFVCKTPLPVISQTGMFPADREYVGYGSDVRLEFQGLGREDVFYQVVVRDYNQYLDLYISPASRERFAVIPAGLLQPNTAYKWCVRALDDIDDPMVMSESAMSNFFTGVKGGLSSDNFVISFDGARGARLYARNVPLAPWDIDFITVTIPDSRKLNLKNELMVYLDQPPRYASGFASPFPPPNGLYTFDLQSTDGQRVTTTHWFQYEQMPLVPEETRVPTDHAYLASTQPAFTWDPAVGSGYYYYSVVLKDFSDRAFVYSDPRKVETRFTVPYEVNLPTACSFKWYILSFNKDLPEMILNGSMTSTRTFTLNPTLRGRITDTVTGGAVCNAVVEAKCRNEHYLTTTNAAGYYDFSDLPSGEYKVEVALGGYKKEKARLTVDGSGTMDMNFVMEPKKEEKEKEKK